MAQRVMLAGLLAAAVGATLGSARAAVTRPHDIYARVTHLGWIVEDVAATTAAWTALGVRNIGEPEAEAFDVALPGGTRHVRVKKSTGYLGAVRVDWMQPLDAGGPYREFLERHGAGIHHVGYTIPDESVFDREVEALTAIASGSVRTGHRKCSRVPTRFAWLEAAGLGGGAIDLEVKPDAPDPSPPSNEDPFNRVTQFAFVVRDVEAVSRQWERLGFPPLRVEPNVSLDRAYRGAPGTFEMLLGWNRSGEVPFEWIQPTKGPSVYGEYLEAHGEGFHHIGLDVADMDLALATLQRRGLAVTMSGGWNANGYEGRFAYLDTERVGGVTIELLWNKGR